jgi:hypothetical protein
MNEWQPMSRDQAERGLGEFLERTRGQAVTLSFDDHLYYREAFLVLARLEPDAIRRELDRERGLQLDD